MTSFLMFTLHAPLASWGEIAVGEARGSWDRPSRSAVLGLMAAAVGIPRDAQAQHDALGVGYGVAVRLDAPGTPLMDYHTAQTVSASVAMKHGVSTRAQLLAAGDPETILSRRAYRQDSVATVGLWIKMDAAPPLADLEMALRHPVFTLYAGRKANVFALPLAPEIVEAPTLAEAFLRRAETRGIRGDAPAGARGAVDRVWALLRPRNGWAREIAHDPWDGPETGLRPLRRETRRDSAPHRTRWHFAERVVEIGLLPSPSPGEAGI